jgi:hypothetical protein
MVAPAGVSLDLPSLFRELNEMSCGLFQFLDIQFRGGSGWEVIRMVAGRRSAQTDSRGYPNLAEFPVWAATVQGEFEE